MDLTSLNEQQKKAVLKKDGPILVMAGARVGDISAAVEKYARSHNLGIVKELCGHGIGTDMHEDPNVPNYGAAGTGPILKAGMVICIEPESL